MSHKPLTAAPELLPASIALNLTVDRLTSAPLSYREKLQLVLDARRYLAALPLPADRFARGICNLVNAESYLRRGETGAAKFELRQLLSAAAV
jgi:hypothetical protein